MIKQNKFIGWVISILIVLNLLSLTMVWLQKERTVTSYPKESDGSPSGSVQLLQREIGLSDEQVNKFQQMRSDHMKKTKKINDELDDLKLRLVDKIFDPQSDQKLADSIAVQIGILQSQVEKMRFEHFKALVQICNPEQREKLQPILREVFGKKVPVENPERRPPEQRIGEKPKMKPGVEENRPPRPEERNTPPSKDEKLHRYTERLSLTSDQIKKVNDIFISTRTKEEAFKMKSRPSPSEFELEKDKIHKEEDDCIMRILNPDQKKEFENMIKNREKHIPH